MYTQRVAFGSHRVKPRLCSTVQNKVRASTDSVDDADVFHEDSLPETSSNCFCERLFGCKTFCQGSRLGEWPSPRFCPFDIGKYPRFEPFAEPVERSGDTFDVAKVGADAEDQRAESMTSLMSRTA